MSGESLHLRLVHEGACTRRQAPDMTNLKEKGEVAMAEMKASPAVKLDTLSDINDLGKPWRFEEGDLTVTRLSPWSAPGCHPTGCGLKVYTDGEGKVVKVEGDENHPVTQGRL